MDHTLRAQLLERLREGPRTAKELSGLIGIREREVLDHLEHLRRSLHRSGERLIVAPAECRACGHRFAKRDRLTRPGSCPRCRAQRISSPAFHVAGA